MKRYTQHIMGVARVHFFFGYGSGLSFFLTLRLVAEDNGCQGLEVEMATWSSSKLTWKKVEVCREGA